MTRWVGLLFAGVVAAACGHEVTTGSARNDWATPSGYANATDPRYINPDAPAHPAHDRSVFAKREAPPLQAAPTEAEPESTVPPPSDAVPPPSTTVPDETLPRDNDEPPPYVTPIQPQP